MKKTTDRLLALILCLCLALPCMTVGAHAAAAASGTCGENLTWVLDDAGTLTISGTGWMNSYRIMGAPWYDYRQQIKAIVIEEGVASIGTHAFFSTHAVSVDIPASVTGIGTEPFLNCIALQTIRCAADNPVFSSEDGILFNKKRSELVRYPPAHAGSSYAIPESITELADGAFDYCCRLKDVTIPGTIETIGNSTFSGCSGLTSMTIPEGVDTIGRLAFQNCSALVSVSLPASLYWVREKAFVRCNNLSDVYYNGTTEYYAQLRIDAGNEALTDAAFHFRGNPELAILLQPKSAIGVIGGELVPFHVRAVGEGLTYQWQYRTKNGATWRDTTSAAVGSHKATLQVEAVEARDGYHYRCVVKDASGASLTSGAATLYNYAPPVITTQPADAAAVVGEVVRFTIGVSSQAKLLEQPDENSLTYRWQYRAPGDTDWSDDYTDNASDRNTLWVYAASAKDGYRYRCVLTDWRGTEVISGEAALTVLAGPPVVTGQPKDYTGELGSTAVFRVSAAGSGLAYQWQYKSLKDGKWRSASAEGSDTATMRIAITAARNGMCFRCAVTDESGRTITSDAAKLYAAVKPIITVQPENFAGELGSTASFTVNAVGSGLAYQWQYKSLKDGKWYNANTNDSNSWNLRIEITAARNGMYFRCVVTDANGEKTVSDAARLYAAVRPIIIGQPEDYTGLNGSTASFTVNAVGRGLAFQWQYKSFKDGKWYNTNTDGSDSRIMRIGVTESRDGMYFRCVVTDENGSRAVSDAARLRIG